MSILGDKCIAAGLPVLQADEIRAMFTRDLTAAEDEIYLDILTPERIIHRADRQQLKDEYIATITQLQNIESAVSPTNAQVIAAVKFMAKTLILLLKILARMV